MPIASSKLGCLRAPLIAAALSVLSACVTHTRPQPHTRFGALPFPGPTSLFHAADPRDLGDHHYGSWSTRPFDVEGERGIIYTHRAGFLDMVHIRNAADWTWYVHGLMREQRAHASVEGPHPIVFDYEGAGVRVAMPLNPADDPALAARTAYAILAWHEASTWYGHSMVPLVSERRSAFTYDDTTSHLVGVNAAFQVIRAGATDDTYDGLMTARLDTAITTLLPRTPGGTLRACTDARGLWWDASAPILRDTAVHLDASPKRPLLLTSDGGAAAGDAPLALPSLTSTLPDDWITIHTQPDTHDRVHAALGSTTIRGTHDLERIIADVARDLAAMPRTTVLRDGEAVPPTLATRNTNQRPAKFTTGPVVAQFIAPVKPGAARVESADIDAGAPPTNGHR